MSDPDTPSQLERWVESTWRRATERFPERKAPFVTASGIELEPLYAPTPESADYRARVGVPGEAPFTRGVQPTMYRGRFWTMRQYAGFATAEESNRRYRALLESGTTGLSVAFDLPTQIGYDPDDPMATGEVGRVGVSIATLEDMETLLDGIPLDKISISMTINSTAIVLIAFLIAVAKRQGIDPARLRGTVQNDMFKEFIARGTQRLPVRPSLRLVTDVIEYATEHMPLFNPVSISGYHIREAGATAVEEVAFTLADGLGYIDAALERGLSVDDFAPRLSFFFNAHNHLFEEVAKFRAARRLWANLVEARYHPKNPKSRMLRFHTQTGGSTLQARQVDVNVVRVAVQALAAVLGGTQSLHTNGRDEALNLPSEEAAVLALRTQQVLANESGVTDVIDPLGGSPYIETLTDQVEAGARVLLSQIDDLGGTLAAVEAGFPQRCIEKSAYEAQRRIESGEDVVVGVNRYEVDDEVTPPTFALDPEMESNAVARVRAYRARRDEAAAQGALEALAQEIRGAGNLVPAVLEAVEAGATLGEIMARMETRYGTFLAPAAGAEASA